MKAGIEREFEKLVKMYRSSQNLQVSHSRARIEKRRIVDEAKKYLSNYRTLVLLDVAGVPARFRAYIEKKLEGLCAIKMFKGSLLEIAMKELNLRNAGEFSKYLTGQNLALFTNLNSFEIALLLNKISMPVKSRVGEKVDIEIRVPPMKTDLKPGPVMSLFGKLRIPIQVVDGVISIVRESTIAKPGDTITPELASLFTRLGIEPRFIKPVIKAIYEDGLILTPDKLVVDVDGVKQELSRGISYAFNLASELVIPHPDVIRLSITKAYNRAIRLAAEAGFISRETAQHILSIAISRALAIAMMISQKVPDLLQQLPTPVKAVEQQSITQQVQQEEGRRREEEKEVLEEQLAEGLSALFG